MNSLGKMPLKLTMGIRMKSYLPDVRVNITEEPVSSADFISDMWIWRDGGHFTVSSAGK